MNPKRRDHLLKVVLLLFGLCALFLTTRNRDEVFPTNAVDRPERSHAVRRSSGQSIWEVSRVQQAPLDWKHLCKIAVEEGGRSWLEWKTKQARYERGLKKLTVDELLGLLAEIRKLACSESTTVAINTLILESLIEKEPLLGFPLGMDLLKDKDKYLYADQMNLSFQAWVARDPEAADKWLREQDPHLSTGKAWQGLFGSMRSALISQLLRQDPTRLADVVGSLPVEYRYGALKGGFANWNDGLDDLPAVGILRQFLPRDEQILMIGEIYYGVAAFGDYQRLGNVLQSLSPTVDERNEIMFAASKARMQMGTGKPPQESLDEIRSWVGKQAPGVLDRVTGEFISINFSRDRDEKHAEELVLKYHDAGASDDVITAFIESSESEKSPEAIKRLKEHLRTGSEGEHE